DKAKYWKGHGYDFDPEKMNASEMDLHALEKDPKAYWKRLGIHYDDRLMDKTKIQLQIAAQKRPNTDSFMRSRNRDNPANGYTRPAPIPIGPTEERVREMRAEVRASEREQQRQRDLTNRSDPRPAPATSSPTASERFEQKLTRAKLDHDIALLRSRQSIGEREAERTRVSTPGTLQQDRREQQTGRETPNGQRVTVHTPFPRVYNERRDNPRSQNRVDLRSTMTNLRSSNVRNTTVRSSLMPFNARRDLRPTSSGPSSGSSRTESSLTPLNARRASRDYGNSP
ncbi:MAG: hypothetical protein ACYTGQ_13040, partial [Planctomycetota bacterium]